MKETDLTFSDWKKRIPDLGTGEWITVSLHVSTEAENLGIHCALIPQQYVAKCLEDPSWELLIGHGFPGFVFSFENGQEKAEYQRFSDDSGIEPLVYQRDFHGVKPGYNEISEEFRHYFNLYHDQKNNKLVHIDDNGDEEDVVQISATEIRVKQKFLKKYLSARNMKLALYFEVDRFSAKTLQELGATELDENVKEADYTYSLFTKNESFMTGKKSFGRLLGKKLVSGLKDFRPTLSSREDKTFEEFIIGVDGDGNPVVHSCDEDKLSNYFGKNPGSPHFLTPVFFKKEVLTKYYANPEQYSVEDGYLRRQGLWGLRMDNNHPDFIMVFLGDLGHLAPKEQLYWKSFNVAYSGGMSRTAFKRGFEAEFADPEQSDLYFKQHFRSFNERWKKAFGWDLFRPLSEKDQHYFDTLRVPLTDSQSEFDQQVLGLVKVFIDSLNEAELAKIGKPTKENAKGIDKLEAFLAINNINSPAMIQFFRDLQDLRSTGVVHLKGKNYEKMKSTFGIGEKSLREVFDDILIKAVWTLNTLGKRFLNTPTEKE